MSADDVQAHPEFASYVRYKFPQLIHVGPVVHNLKKHGSLTTEEITHALQWGNDPLIVITDLSNNQCGVPAAFGCFEHSKPDQVEIDPEFVNDFENDPNGAGTGKNAGGKGVFIAGVTLLHEMCHWGNFMHGTAETQEEGAAFERATYGKIVP
jgi:hypothetical protein